MRFYKRIAFFIGIVLVLSALVSCGGDSQSGLVVYTSFRDESVRQIVDAFTEETGVNVALTFAGTGVLIERIRAEEANPIADVLWGGMLPSVIPVIDLFDEYASINEPFMQPAFRNTEGAITRYMLSLSVIMVNTAQLPSHITINGYADLLNPELKGRIAITDPSSSASAFNHLVNKLYAMGGADGGWDFIEQFVDNLDGIMLSSSSAVINGVASGEYWVGLTFEEGPMPFINAGAPVEMVYMSEGVMVMPEGVLVVQDAPNIDNARLFIDFVTSFEAQNMMEQDLFGRTTRNDVPSGETLTPISQLNIIEVDLNYILANRDTWLHRFQMIWEG